MQFILVSAIRSENSRDSLILPTSQPDRNTARPIPWKRSHGCYWAV